MSTTTLLALEVGSSCRELKSFKNASGFADYVWTELCKSYLGASDKDYIYNGLTEKLWPYFKDTQKPYFERIVLAITYDRAFICKDDYSEAARCIRQFLSKYPPNPSHSNHWADIADFFESKPKHESVGFIQSSVVGNLFRHDTYLHDPEFRYSPGYNSGLEFVEKNNCFNVFSNTPIASEE
jgi:hypothetical protein